MKMNFHSQIPSAKLSTKLLEDLAIVRKHLQDVEDHSPTIDRINPLRQVDAELSLRLLHFLSAELNVQLSLPENFPMENNEDEPF
tara:strand:+ start:1370 stop:1624 length:255 start_codon:yes stop_codon:yes gene_type:complete